MSDSTDAARYARVHAILAEIRSLDDASRRAYLAEHCVEEPALRQEIVDLLEVVDDDRDDAFAERSIQGARASLETLVSASESAWVPASIGGYEVVRQIGQGGMGIVYEAIQSSPRRRVAIKLLHPIHATPDRLRRFQKEAEVLGRLEHPGIARIFEAATYDAGRGRQPFIAMEFVEGTDLRAHCHRAGLSRRERLDLVAHIADAVQYAHGRGIIHRDLKPDNVLVNQRGAPVVLDFGIARVADSSAGSTMLTDTGQIVGTLAYMAPEQFTHASDSLTPLVDVYALGVLAFELLTGQLPRNIEDLPVPRAMSLLATTDAPAAGLIDPALRGDVETILARALESSPAHRYASAAALAGDVRRSLANRPIEARPPSRMYRMKKFVLRHGGLVSGTVATLLVAIAGAIIATTLAVKATRLSETEARRAAAMERQS